MATNDTGDVKDPDRVTTTSPADGGDAKPVEKKPQKKQAAAAAAPAAASSPVLGDDVEIKTASTLFAEQQQAMPLPRGRPQIKNKVLRHLIICESCNAALDYPFVHQRCQHVVCALCANNNRHSPLCKTCRASMLNTGNHLAVITSFPHSARLSDVVVAVGGRDWINHVRHDLNTNQRAAFLQATTTRNEMVRTNNPAYQEGVNKTIPLNGDDDDNDDYDGYRGGRRSTRCGGDGCCGCLLDVICCCGMYTCFGDFCRRGKRWWKWLGIAIVILVILSWTATGINYLITGKTDLNNVIYGGETPASSNYDRFNEAPLKMSFHPTVPLPMPPPPPPRRDL